MKVDRVVRAVIALIILILLVAVLAAFLFVTESALNVWARLGEGPAWIRYAFVGVFVSALLAALWGIWRFVVPSRAVTKKKSPAPVSEDTLLKQIDLAEQSGANVAAAKAELRELDARRGTDTIHVCVFGEVSAGKSTLIAALLPGADVATSPVGGSTVEIRHYTWQSPEGGRVLLTDVPGTGSAGDNLDKIAREEALRAHVVLYVCDADLTRQQLASLTELGELGKPTVIVLNKTDRYSETDLARLRERIRERLAQAGDDATRTALVSVTAGGEEEVIRADASGHEERVVRARPVELTELKLAIREMLARDPATLSVLRDQAVFRLAGEKLSAAQQTYRQERAAAIVAGYTKKAVIGALAAVSPGSDIIIQGYLGSAMTRAVCALWDVSVRDMDVEEFLNLSQSRVGRALPLSLAVAGNGLKAFPGIGTLAGGLVHAVAYGLIFDALGRSLADSLSRRGEFVPAEAAREFEGSLSEHMEKGVRQVARLALADRNTASGND